MRNDSFKFRVYERPESEELLVECESVIMNNSGDFEVIQDSNEEFEL